MEPFKKSPVQQQSSAPPPPGGAPVLDLDPTSEQIEEFKVLVQTGKKRYEEMLTAKPYGLTDEQLRRRQENYERHYKTTPAPDGYENGPTPCFQTKAPELPETTYINALDHAKGEIRAYHNVGPIKKKDNVPVVLPDWHLSGSEVLFQQYRVACGERIAPLRTLQRCNVASGTGNVVMAATIRVLGKDQLTGSTLTVGDSDDKVTVHFPGRTLVASRRDLFYAWLGTENGASATWLIRDHGPRLGIGGISHIVVNSVQNITIYFTE